MTAGTINKIIAACLLIIMLGVYIMTVAPTLSFWDCGEFITCSFIMGIPHPPGSPLLSLIGRVFSLIPFYDFRGEGLEEIAFRVNMIDVILGALTVMLTYLIMVRLIHKFRPPNGRRLDDAVTMFTAVITAFLVAFSDEFWSNAIETETYMPSLFMSMLAVWLTLRWDERKEDPKAVRYLFLASYLIGIGNGVHLTVLLIAPTVFLLVLFSKPQWFSEKKLWLYLAVFMILAAVIKLFTGLEILYFSMAVFAFAAPFILYRLSMGNRAQWMVVLLGLIFCGSLYIIGFSVYPTVMVRAGKSPIINEGNPDNWERYKLYMAREQYGQENMYIGIFTRNASFKYQFGYMYLRYLIQQFPKWGPTISVTFDNNRSADYPEQDVTIRDEVSISVLLLSLLIYGIYTHAREDWKRFSAFLIFFIVSSVGLALYLNMKNPQVRERAYFFLGSFYIISYWIGFGIYGVITDIQAWFQEKNSARLIAPVTVALFILFATIVPVSIASNHIDPKYTNWQAHDRTEDWAPFDYAYNILISCDKDAILFTNGDNDTFPLWYLQEVKGFRKDVRIVNLSLLNTDWYILQNTHESVSIPQEPVLLSKKEQEYVRPVSTERKTIPVQFSDDFIENTLCGHDDQDLALRVWPIEGKNVEAAGISWKLPTYHHDQNYGMIRIQDVMVYKIIEWVNWTRPIFFAVTVAQENKIGLDDYLAMEGMVSRLVKNSVAPGYPNVDVPVLDNNVFNVYKYRSLTDDSVYKPPNTLKLVTNYFIGFAQLCERYVSMGDKENATRAARGAIERTLHDLSKRVILYKIMWNGKITDELKEFLDNEIRNPDFIEGREGLLDERLQVAGLLDTLGEHDKASTVVRNETARLNLKNTSDKIEFGTRLFQNSLDSAAIEYFKEIIADDSTSVEAWKVYASLLYSTGQLGEAINALGHLGKLTPGDKSVQESIKILSEQERRKSLPDSQTMRQTPR
ncbi:DUF2723 domain-containing protein [bacterium]|nr:DUF2723 domain-containing protein [bacterium]